MFLVAKRYSDGSAHRWQGHEGTVIPGEPFTTDLAVYPLWTRAGEAYGYGSNPNGYRCTGEALVLLAYSANTPVWGRHFYTIFPEGQVLYAQPASPPYSLVGELEFEGCDDPVIIAGVRALATCAATLTAW